MTPVLFWVISLDICITKWLVHNIYTIQVLADNNDIYKLRVMVRNTGNPDEDYIMTYTPAVSTCTLNIK